MSIFNRRQQQIVDPEYTHLVTGYSPRNEYVPMGVNVIAFEESQNAFLVDIPIAILSVPSSRKHGEVQSPYGVEKITLADYKTIFSRALTL